MLPHPNPQQLIVTDDRLIEIILFTGFVIIVALVLLLIGVFVVFCFTAIVNFVIDKVSRDGFLTTFRKRLSLMIL